MKILESENHHRDTEAQRKLHRSLMKFLSPLCGFTVVISFLALPPVFAYDENPDLQKGKEELQGIQSEIKEKKKRLVKAGKKEKQLLAEIDRISKRLSILEEEERKLDMEIMLLEKGLTEKANTITDLRSEAEKKEELLKKRLVYLYKSGSAGYLRFLLSYSETAGMGRRFEYLKRVAAYDKKMIDEYGKGVTDLSRQADRIRINKEELTRAEEELEKKRAEIKREKKERDRLLAEARKEKRRYKLSLKELEANARNLQQLLDRLEKETAARTAASLQDSGFGRWKGLLEFPVKGEVVGFFGRETEKGSGTAVYRKGIEIRADGSVVVKAVYGGRIIYSGQFKGYGMMVIVDHGEGYYTLYAHLTQLYKNLNDEIKKDDIIGKTGDGGGESSLYFEIRKGGKPENPMEWLKS